MTIVVPAYEGFPNKLRYNPHDWFVEKTGYNIHIYDYKKEYGNKAMLSVLPPVSGKEPAKPGTEKNDKQFYVDNYTYSLHIVVAVDSFFR